MTRKFSRKPVLLGVLCLAGILALLVLVFASPDQPSVQIGFVGYTSSAGRDYIVFEGTNKESYVMFWQVWKASREVLSDAVIKDQGLASGGTKLTILLPRHYEDSGPIDLQWHALKTTKSWLITSGNFLLKHGMVSLANLFPQSMSQSDLVIRSVPLPLPEPGRGAQTQPAQLIANPYE